MKVLMTGAHFTPAQAVIEELKHDYDISIIYIGRNTTLEGDKTPSVESQTLPALGVKFYPITAGRLRRFLSWGTITSLLKIPVGFIQAFSILVKEKPDVVLSFGGYVAVPVVISAWLLRIPVIVHEQTLISGLANQVSNFFASKIAVSFDKEYSFDKSKIVLTGNPLRKELLGNKANPSPEIESFFKEAKKEGLPVILITGGNQGSHLINQTVSEALSELTNLAFIFHQTGDSKFKDYEKLLEKKNDLKFKNRYIAKKWVEADNLTEIFKEVDLVISRAGANTLYELSYFTIPALVIPLPYLYQDEQNKNAKFFSDNGLCEVLSQVDLTPDSLLLKLKEMLSNLDNLKSRAKDARKIVILDAAKKLADETKRLAHV